MFIHSIRKKKKPIKLKKSIKRKSIKKKSNFRYKQRYDGVDNKKIYIEPINLDIINDTKDLSSLIRINYCKEYNDISNETKNFFYKFYKKFLLSDKFVQELKIQEEIYEKIPKNEDFDLIVDNIQDIIKKNSSLTYKYSLSTLDKSLNIYFVVFNNNILKEEIKNNLYKILFWLHVINDFYEDKSCSNELNIYIYLTDKLKVLPDKKHDDIKREHVNTGFTYTCLKKNSIVIYRKEEWFKVFIHETFHNLKLDFSNMNNNNTKKYINNLFKVNSDVKLYEAYTDSWAKIINVLICSYFMSFKNKIDFFYLCIENINLERTFCMFQSIKILDHMGLNFEDLYSDDTNITSKYKEETSVLSYYIINAIILNSYEDFIIWCTENNKNILQFTHTSENQIKFCKFIENHCKKNDMLYRIKCVTNMFNYYKNLENKNNNEKYLLKNMRKSLFQLN